VNCEILLEMIALIVAFQNTKGKEFIIFVDSEKSNLEFGSQCVQRSLFQFPDVEVQQVLFKQKCGTTLGCSSPLQFEHRD